ncbi:MAG: hypothetical protein RLZZ241_319 [Bacteroidota bacterium]|jgi:hypothetical protein
MKLNQLNRLDCPSYYHAYLDNLPENVELLEVLENQLENFPEFLQSIPSEKLDFRYLPNKWSLLESLVHVLDTERVFQYRALVFGRKDSTSLPGFDQDLWVPNSKCIGRDIQSIIEEYRAIRLSTIYLFKNFTALDLEFKGISSEKQISLGALGFLICGHQRHHRDLIRTKYLKG